MLLSASFLVRPWLWRPGSVGQLAASQPSSSVSKTTTSLSISWPGSEPVPAADTCSGPEATLERTEGPVVVFWSSKMSNRRRERILWASCAVKPNGGKPVTSRRTCLIGNCRSWSVTKYLVFVPAVDRARRHIARRIDDIVRCDRRRDASDPDGIACILSFFCFYVMHS